jgi:dTDP-4-dehydrorhamnose reductase
MKRILLIGANGLIGQHLTRIFAPTWRVFACGTESTFADPKIAIEGYRKLDITRRSEVKHYFTTFNPEMIVNTVSLRNINLCEKERTLCWDVNVRGIEHIIEACQSFKPIFVQISSAHIFNGISGMYRENDIPEPVNYFGQSVLAAEKIVQRSSLEYLIARTVSVYGNGYKINENFVSDTKAKLARNETVDAITNHTMNPTIADDLAYAIFRLIEKEEFGTFHIAGSQSCSYYDFAQEIAQVFNLNKRLIKPITAEDAAHGVPWSKNATFSLDKLYNTIDWLPSNVRGGLIKYKNRLA